ncbi:SRPBCC family protein [Actinomadura barringtoniae]|uniref:SRPBCC family protein n=1 Tax=Actinomadura barringtoniae TaxID=1427535 RepID=A0A939PED7_9ACTN|nr:SRPBCC family protein [Actinomadura barringtoniae]MBO2450692.1 SRPBCC family protein [Actinomadura barringtoniae]
MPKFRFQLDVSAPPAQVIGAMVDFSDRRPEIWPNLTARLYTLHDLNDRKADVTEGTAVPGLEVWERCTYEWTDTTVRSVITDGRIFEPGGTFEFHVEPQGTGTRITVDYDRRSTTILGRCIGAMMHLSRGAPIKRSFKQVYK